HERRSDAELARPRQSQLASVLIPRPFQAELLDAARTAIRGGARRILIQLPTGGGKTVVAALMMRGMRERERLSYFLAHRRELLSQTARTFADAELAHGYTASGKPYDPAALTQLVGLAYAVRRREEIPPPANAIIDEAHHAL